MEVLEHIPTEEEDSAASINFDLARGAPSPRQDHFFASNSNMSQEERSSFAARGICEQSSLGEEDEHILV